MSSIEKKPPMTSEIYIFSIHATTDKPLDAIFRELKWRLFLTRELLQQGMTLFFDQYNLDRSNVDNFLKDGRFSLKYGEGWLQITQYPIDLNPIATIPHPINQIAPTKWSEKIWICLHFSILHPFWKCENDYFAINVLNQKPNRFFPIEPWVIACQIKVKQQILNDMGYDRDVWNVLYSYFEVNKIFFQIRRKDKHAFRSTEWQIGFQIPKPFLFTYGNSPLIFCPQYYEIV
jgi:hypothetical protein